MVSRAVRAGAICAAFVAATPGDGAAFTVMTSDSVRELWCASDSVAARIPEVQFVVGEGPALTAFTTSRPVLIADLSSTDVTARWPAFTAETTGLPIGGLFAFPMHLGALTLGVCELYRRRPGQLTAIELGSVLRALDTATLSLLSLRAAESIDGMGADDAGMDGASADGDRDYLGTRQVHQATGMLIAQLGVDAEQAFARLRAHAYSEGKDIVVVAEDIIARRLRLEPDLPPTTFGA